MELIVKRGDLFDGLLKTQNILEKRSTMPILSNVFLESRNKKLRIRATDLDIGIDAIYDAEVIKEGSLTIPGKKLFEMVREIDEVDLKITRKENNYMEIKAGKAVFNIMSLPAEEYPAFPQYEDKVFFKFPGQTVSNMIEKTIYAVSNDEIRYTLNGIFMEKVDNSIRMVSTDGHRLSMMQFSDASVADVSFGKSVIIPRKGAAELKKLLDSTPEDVYVSIKDNNGVFKAGNTVLVMRMIDGEFPDYRQVIPKGSDKVAKISKELLIKILRRVSILSSEKSKGVKITFTKGQMDVSTTNPEIGEASENVECEFDGTETVIGFNAKYLIEVLNSIEEGMVRMEMKDELGPVIVKGEENKDHISIIMPMRL